MHINNRGPETCDQCGSLRRYRDGEMQACSHNYPPRVQDWTAFRDECLQACRHLDGRASL